MGHQFSAYILLSAMGTLAHYVVMGFLLLWTVSPTAASIVGALVGASINFVFSLALFDSRNTRLRFSKYFHSVCDLKQRIARFVVVAGLVASLNGILVAGLYQHVGVWVAQGVASVVTLFVSYALNKHWTFASSTTQWLFCHKCRSE